MQRASSTVSIAKVSQDAGSCGAEKRGQSGSVVQPRHVHLPDEHFVLEEEAIGSRIIMPAKNLESVG